MAIKVTMDEIKEELSLLKNYEKVRDLDDKAEVKKITIIYKKYCDAMHSAGLQNYMRFYLLFICSASRSYVKRVFDWNDEMVVDAEKTIYEHLYNEFNKKAG